jgi:hypothetical protein
VRIDLMPTRVCENCARDYAPTYPTQRWCSSDCRQEFRNAELQAARKLYARAGRPRLEEVEQQFGGSAVNAAEERWSDERPA